MHVMRRAIAFAQGFLASYAPSGIKRLIWDRDFSTNKWDFLDDTAQDCVYPYLERYACNGDILDLGCGPGNTANELAFEAYGSYIGVDISEVCLAKAAKRTQENGRSDKNSFVRSDFLGYTPSKEFDVILFRESLYHVPFGQVKPLLKKYAQHLKPSGVFIVRLYAGDKRPGKVKYRVMRKINLIKREFDVIESHRHESERLPTVLVFRRSRASRGFSPDAVKSKRNP